ncbi:HAMP domain-containing sensor histidine kinase [Streptomyces chartreusis]|uniref:sensor histidine kinase n=1 Tax=Streptomyces chartreusis TaxID=1969 RepID=UPI002E17E144
MTPLPPLQRTLPRPGPGRLRVFAQRLRSRGASGTPAARLPRLRPGAGRTSLRWQITATVTAVGCAVALVLSVLAHNTMARHIIGQARLEAEIALDTALAHHAAGNPPAPHTLIAPAHLPDRLRRLAENGERGTMVGTHHDQPVMWAAARADSKVLATWRDYRPAQQAVRDLDRTITLAATAASACVALAAVLAAARISRRLRATASVARRITAGDLSARAHPPGPPPAGATRNEADAVALALDTMAGALHERLTSERRFTADVAHELRTPLTGLLTSASLLPDGRPKEMIIDRLRQLHHLTEDLLEISRLDARAEQADIALHDLADLVQRCLHATNLAPHTHITIVQNTLIATDRRRLERIITNLAVNAHRHGKPPVGITIDGPLVHIRDHGPGYPDDLLHHGPRRFRTSPTSHAKGHGLGLTIATGQARVIGATLTFTNPPGGGALTIVRLPTPATAAAGHTDND